MFNALALCLLAPAAYSAPQWYFTFGAGAEVPSLHSSVTVNNNSLAAPPFNEDSYSSQHNVNAAILVEAGKRWAISASGLKAVSLGLQYQYYLSNDIGRQVMQYSSPQYLNYRYRLALAANLLMLNAKLDLFTWKSLTPFISIGAGGVQLMATNYSEYAYSNITARISPAFQENTNYQFTYQAGAGVGWSINQKFMASVNYSYQPLGSFTTKWGRGTWSNRKLDFGNVDAQSVFVAVTYLA